ncbi:amidotransferase [bacterium]|nr:amidotransferase [bacterium]
MKVAILETDILRENLQPTYVGYGRMFQDLFAEVGVDWQMPIFSVIKGEYPETIDDFDAFLITGSKHDAFADDAWIQRLRDYCRQLFDAGKPMIGICFGHQLLAHTLGGKAERADAGWGLGVMRYQLTDSPDFIDGDEDVSLLVSHRDQVTALPPGAKPLLNNGFCPLAAFYIPGQVLCFQGHPEFSKDYEQALLEYRLNDVSREQMDRIRASLADDHQGERIGRWMKAFVEQAVDAPLQR